MLFYQLLKNNASNFCLSQPGSSTTYDFEAIDKLIAQLYEPQKRFGFIYTDNSLHNTALVLAALAQPNCAFALLNSALNLNHKHELEENYTPDFIVDPTRNSIENYNNIDHFDQPFFSTTRPIKSIHGDVKLLLTTSGSTGSSKFVKLSETNIVSNAISITQYLPITQNDICPLNLPLFYAYGLSILTSNAIAGATIVTQISDIVTRDFWNQFKEMGFTSFAGVPFVYEMLHRLGFTKKELPSLRYFTQAGGKLRQQLIEIFGTFAQENQKAFYIMYGQTEATARMAYLEPTVLLSKIGSIGKAIPGGKLSLGTNDELLYSGKNVFGGYAASRMDLNTFDQEIQLHTGDLARVDNDGYYYITGRLKRFVKLFGNRINLDEVEKLLEETFIDMRFAAWGHEDKTLFVATNTSPEKIKNHLSLALNIHISGIKVMEVQDFPLLANGKLDYMRLQSLVE